MPLLEVDILELATAGFFSLVVMVFVQCLYIATKEGGLFQKYGEWLDLKEVEHTNKDDGSVFIWSALGHCPFCTCFWLELIACGVTMNQMAWSIAGTFTILFTGTFLIYYINYTEDGAL